MEGQIIQPFFVPPARIGSLQEIRSPSLIQGNFKKLTKVLLNHVEPTQS